MATTLAPIISRSLTVDAVPIGDPLASSVQRIFNPAVAVLKVTHVLQIRARADLFSSLPRIDECWTTEPDLAGGSPDNQAVAV